MVFTRGNPVNNVYFIRRFVKIKRQRKWGNPRNSLPLKQERSPKGNENRENCQNPLPFHGRSGRKGNVNGGTQRNSLPFDGRSGQKGSVNRETQRNPLPFHQLFLDLGRTGGWAGYVIKDMKEMCEGAQFACLQTIRIIKPHVISWRSGILRPIWSRSMWTALCRKAILCGNR